ncbi:MAG: diacylglycerol/lipid kinase family protein [Anaerolineae bacterium]
MNYRIIVNPVAGRGAGARAVPEIEQLLHSHGLRFDLVCTERPWHAAELAQQAATDGCDVVVAVGGDGTSNEVLNGLMSLRPDTTPGACEALPAMGVLCVGRGNDFAYGAGIPTDLEQGVAALANGERREIDVGHVYGGLYPEGRYFGNGIGIGFDAVVGFIAARQIRLSGSLSYLLAAMKTIFLYYHAPFVAIDFNDMTLQMPSLMVSVMNGRRMGGAFMMAPKSEPADGLLDLCIARDVNPLRALGLIPHFMRGTQMTQRPITMAKTARLRVTAREGTLPAHADGETLCKEGHELEVFLLPRQIEVITASPEREGA